MSSGNNGEGSKPGTGNENRALVRGPWARAPPRVRYLSARSSTGFVDENNNELEGRGEEIIVVNRYLQDGNELGIPARGRPIFPFELEADRATANHRIQGGGQQQQQQHRRQAYGAGSDSDDEASGSSEGGFAVQNEEEGWERPPTPRIRTPTPEAYDRRATLRHRAEASLDMSLWRKRTAPSPDITDFGKQAKRRKN